LDADGRQNVEIVNPWRKDLVGAHVLLPDKDLWGRTIPKNRPCFVPTISCSSCGDPRRLLDLLQQSPIRPVVVASEAFTPKYAEALRSAQGIWAIETGAGDGVVPDPMLQYAPQVAFVDAQGNITAVPSSDMSLEAFIKSGGKRK
jgi:hypothetical protein